MTTEYQYGDVLVHRLFGWHKISLRTQKSDASGGYGLQDDEGVQLRQDIFVCGWIGGESKRISWQMKQGIVIEEGKI
ncbi:MAG: hypothetical protein NC121_09375 [Blautia sp.]|nr:hypothetical protein [Blautia sp.]